MGELKRVADCFRYGGQPDRTRMVVGALTDQKTAAWPLESCPMPRATRADGRPMRAMSVREHRTEIHVLNREAV